MVKIFAVATVYYDCAKLVHELCMFSARSADEAEGLAMHDALTAGRELVSLLTFPTAERFTNQTCDAAAGLLENLRSS